MALDQAASIALPAHAKAGGFDHAAVHAARERVYVAHTAADAVDIIDGATDRYVGSIASLTGVAGVLVSEDRDLVFTSNRGQDSVAWFSPAQEGNLVRVSVGPRPNGLHELLEREMPVYDALYAYCRQQAESTALKGSRTRSKSTPEGRISPPSKRRYRS